MTPPQTHQACCARHEIRTSQSSSRRRSCRVPTAPPCPSGPFPPRARGSPAAAAQRPPRSTPCARTDPDRSRIRETSIGENWLQGAALSILVGGAPRAGAPAPAGPAEGRRLRAPKVPIWKFRRGRLRARRGARAADRGHRKGGESAAGATSFAAPTLRRPPTTGSVISGRGAAIRPSGGLLRSAGRVRAHQRHCFSARGPCTTAPARFGPHSVAEFAQSQPPAAAAQASARCTGTSRAPGTAPTYQKMSVRKLLSVRPCSEAHIREFPVVHHYVPGPHRILCILIPSPPFAFAIALACTVWRAIQLCGVGSGSRGGDAHRGSRRCPSIAPSGTFA